MNRSEPQQPHPKWSQPSPYRVVVSRTSFLLHPPCCIRPVVLARDGTDIQAPRQIECPKCKRSWQAHLRADLHAGVTATWRRTVSP